MEVPQTGQSYHVVNIVAPMNRALQENFSFHNLLVTMKLNNLNYVIWRF